MMNFETPIDFSTKKKISDDIEIIYSLLAEVAQGSPQIGKLSINGKLLSSSSYFGGPSLYKDGYIYTPQFFRKFFSSGFKLAKINVRTFDIEAIGKMKNLIFLDKIEGNKVHYFEDLNKEKQAVITLDK